MASTLDSVPTAIPSEAPVPPRFSPPQASLTPSETVLLAGDRFAPTPAEDSGLFAEIRKEARFAGPYSVGLVVGVVFVMGAFTSGDMTVKTVALGLIGAMTALGGLGMYVWHRRNADAASFLASNAIALLDRGRAADTDELALALLMAALLANEAAGILRFEASDYGIAVAPAGSASNWPAATLESRLQPKELKTVEALISEWLSNQSYAPWRLVIKKAKICAVVRGFAEQKAGPEAPFVLTAAANAAYTTLQPDAADALLDACRTGRPELWHEIRSALGHAIDKRQHEIKRDDQGIPRDHFTEPNPWTLEDPHERSRGEAKNESNAAWPIYALTLLVGALLAIQLNTEPPQLPRNLIAIAAISLIVGITILLGSRTPPAMENHPYLPKQSIAMRLAIALFLAMLAGLCASVKIYWTCAALVGIASFFFYMKRKLTAKYGATIDPALATARSADEYFAENNRMLTEVLSEATQDLAEKLQPIQQFSSDARAERDEQIERLISAPPPRVVPAALRRAALRDGLPLKMVGFGWAMVAGGIIMAALALQADDSAQQLALSTLPLLLGLSLVYPWLRRRRRQAALLERGLVGQGNVIDMKTGIKIQKESTYIVTLHRTDVPEGGNFTLQVYDKNTAAYVRAKMKPGHSLAVLYDPAWPRDAILPQALAENELEMLLESAWKKWF